MPSIEFPLSSSTVDSGFSVAAAFRLAEIARDTAAESERNRRVSPELLEVLRSEGLGGAAVPTAMGGRDIDLPALLGLIETVSGGDGSAGWVAMIYLTTSVAGHYLDPHGLQEVYSDGPGSLTSGVLAPRGTAKRVDGGYIVNGTWPFASGCIDVSWVSVGAMIDGAGGGPGDDSQPTRLSFFLPRNEVGITDTWDVMGLRATASHDVTVDNRFVPDSRVFDLTGPPRTEETIARIPVFGLLAAGIGAVTLGIARAAIDEASDLAGVKVPTGSKRRLIDRPAIQESIAWAETMVAAARCYLFALASPGPSISIQDRARLRMAATFAVSMSRDAVDLMYSAAGGSSLYSRSPLQRHFRDVHAATQHMMVAQPTWELGAKALLGIESDTSSL